MAGFAFLSRKVLSSKIDYIYNNNLKSRHDYQAAARCRQFRKIAMKRLILFFYTLFGIVGIGHTQNRSLSLKNIEVDWETVDEVLKKHIKDKPTFNEGIKDFQTILNLDKNIELITNAESDELKSELNSFMKKVLDENKLPDNVKALSFGIFTSIVDKKESITIYLSGSGKTPKEDFNDWNVDPIYFPKYYLIPKYFESIKSQNYELNGDLEVLIYNGILNLLIINNIEFFKNEILTSNKDIYIGSGFDSGDTYLLGKLTETGIN
ncbi:hypothetical protein [Flavobacterium sp. 102]|uniref:hypothetical protein n=1 Tax=Flavobacterium sp. 102 TaxID=2135623 RepID=UPI000EB5073C|nr:hypothetical protein [Flavobacterium sp. 102]RKS02875.1 hypothetical protein C8C84_2605 [Flavobacterium sp. 102]